MSVLHSDHGDGLDAELAVDGDAVFIFSGRGVVEGELCTLALAAEDAGPERPDSVEGVEVRVGGGQKIDFAIGGRGRYVAGIDIRSRRDRGELVFGAPHQSATRGEDF